MMLSINNTLEGYLKNVEVKGNTIDGKSVGDKVEGKDLYKIPILCRPVSKNLNTGLERGSIEDLDGSATPSDIYMRSKEFMPLDEQMFSISTNSNGWIFLYGYDENKNKIARINVGRSSRAGLYFSVPCKYMKIKYEEIDDPKIQIEYGSTITNYEDPRTEKHEITILSPNQLKSFNGVRDRIVCKNGIWVHEENVVYDEEGNGTVLSKSIDTPLPHGQQVVLKTFSPKTQVMCGCEIEGVIKAEVPKSLGATVNTHTCQIDALHKEIDYLKQHIILQNRLTLTSRYNADNASFKIDYNNFSNDKISNEVDEDLFNLLYQNIMVGKHNYNRDKMIDILDFYAFGGFITWEMWDVLWIIIELQQNPPVEETPEI